jgi:glycosyltransferase involved in cell wall biosynthesis
MDNQANDGLLTVVMPNYNYADFVGEAIASVAAQTYKPIELIVVDDASTDNSVEVIREALAKASNLTRTELIVQPKNSRIHGALNRAFPEVRGKYFIILDADDVLKPEYAERTIAELEKARAEDPSVGFLYTDCTLISGTGEELDRGRSAPFDAKLLERFSYIPSTATCLTKPVIEAAPYDETIVKGTKHHRWMRIVGNGWTGKHVAEPLFCYRMHDKNVSGIGKRVIDEVESGEGGERILSGYWELPSREA